MKILFIDHAGSFSILPGLKKKFGHKHQFASIAHYWQWEVVKSFDPDVVWCEWGDENAAKLSEMIGNVYKNIPLVVRLHGYESHDWFVNKISWDNVAKLVVVSPYFERLMKLKLDNKYPNKKHAEVVRIENGVDLEKFQIPENDSKIYHAIAWMGYLNMKKGPALLRCVAESYPTMVFDVAGKFQCENTRRLLEGCKSENMVFSGWVEPEKWLPKHGWILTTSVTESFSYAVAEGMACGLTPMVYAWPGADELWPPECCWKSMHGLGQIKVKDPQECRNWVVNRYSAERQLNSAMTLLESL